MSKQPFLYLISFIFVIMLFSCQSNEQSKESQVEANPPVTLANTEQFTLYSANTGQEYKICIHLPFSYPASDTVYPLVVGLDADIGFGMISDLGKLLPIYNEVAEVISVGIAYGAYPGQEGNNRTRDYTPTGIADYPGSGGAENFYNFIVDELIPLIDSKYRTDPADRTLAGASLGGLFSLFVLFEHPGVFNRYRIASPSVLWDDRVIFEIEKKYSENYSDLPAKVFLSVGDNERTTESWKEFSQILEDRDYEGLNLTTMVIEDATHLPACTLAGIRGTMVLFATE